MISRTVVITSVTDGEEVVFYAQDSKSGEWQRETDGPYIYIDSYEKDSLERLSFTIPKDELGEIKMRKLPNAGDLVRLDLIEQDGQNKPIGIQANNYFDVNIQINEFPSLLSGHDPIDTVYILKGRLVGGPDHGQEVSVEVSKDSFADHIQPADLNKNVYAPMGVLKSEDARVFFEKGDCFTFKSCAQSNEYEYVSYGAIKRMPFEAIATLVSQTAFSKSAPPFENGLTKLSVIFQNTHYVGRKASFEMSSPEPLDLKTCSTLKLKGVRKMGISRDDGSMGIIVETLGLK